MPMYKPDILEIYTDGATSDNGKENAPGGWAFAAYCCNQLIYNDSGHIENATNNICELTALIKACEWAEESMPDGYIYIKVYSDSAYCINCYKNQWFQKWRQNGWITSKKTPVANKELWEVLIGYFETANFEFIKVKGHADDDRNNFVDRLAVAAKENKIYG